MGGIEIERLEQRDKKKEVKKENCSKRERDTHTEQCPSK